MRCINSQILIILLVWTGAYTVDRVTSVSFRWDESVNTDWKVNWLSYTWKIWNNKILSWKSTTYKFDELGCFPIKLTVKSDTKWTSSIDEVWVKSRKYKTYFVWSFGSTH